MEIEWWCVGKTAYPSKAKAMERIRLQCCTHHRGRRNGWSGDQTMKPYKCGTCGQWHVGGTSKKSVKHTDKNGHVIRRKPNGKEHGHGQ